MFFSENYNFQIMSETYISGTTFTIHAESLNKNRSYNVKVSKINFEDKWIKYGETHEHEKEQKGYVERI